MFYLSGLQIMTQNLPSRKGGDLIQATDLGLKIVTIAESPMVWNRRSGIQLVAEDNQGEALGLIRLLEWVKRGRQKDQLSHAFIAQWLQAIHREQDSIFLALLKALLRHAAAADLDGVAFPASTKFPSPYQSLIPLSRQLPPSLPIPAGDVERSAWKWLDIHRMQQRLMTRHPLLSHFFLKLPHHNI